jgi:hypothetical protein
MENIEKIVGLAVSHHLMKQVEPLTNNGKLAISLDSIEFAIRVVKSMEPEAKVVRTFSNNILLLFLSLLINAFLLLVCRKR